MRFSLAASLEPAPIPPAATSACSKASKANAGQTSPVSLAPGGKGGIMGIYKIYNARARSRCRTLPYFFTYLVRPHEREVRFIRLSDHWTAAVAGILYKCQIPSSHVRVYVSCAWFQREKFYRHTGRTDRTRVHLVRFSVRSYSIYTTWNVRVSDGFLIEEMISN